MEIRERRDGDLEQLVAVAGRVHAADGYPVFLPDRDFKRFLTDPRADRAWVALRGGDVVGHVALAAETSPPVMDLVAKEAPGRAVRYVARLLVDPAARRQGLGTGLLDQARTCSVAGGHLPVLDVVDTASAHAAISLYRRTGWKELGRVRFVLAAAEIDELVFWWPAR